MTEVQRRRRIKGDGEETKVVATSRVTAEEFRAMERLVASGRYVNLSHLVGHGVKLILAMHANDTHDAEAA